jgi:hypothetical protein
MTIPPKVRNTKSARLKGQRYYPFRVSALGYRELGWLGVIPVTRRGTKAPLAPGITGHDGTDADEELLAELIRTYPWGNVGLRPPFDILGIDVDAYDGKGGGRKLRSLYGRLGPLPTTWRSTSRAPEDMVSGIYLFRAPRKPGWKWVSDLGTGSGVEIVQRHHRFVTVEPSLHNSTGRPYRWWRGDREADAPAPRELPTLPVAWGRYLLSSRRFRAGGTATGPETAEWYGRVSGGAMCDGMEKSARDEAARVQAAAELGGLHEALRKATFRLCLSAAEGHTGLGLALRTVETEFARARRDRSLRSEWEGAVKSAMAKAAAVKQDTEDPCSIIGARPIRSRHV